MIAPAGVPLDAATPLLQVATPAVPLTLHDTPPLVSVGATPEEPGTVAVKVRVDGTEPPPLEVRTTVGTTLGTVTTIGAVAANPA